MRFFSIFPQIICVAVFAGALADPTHAAINLDAEFSCMVTESSHGDVPIGSKTREKLSINKIAVGDGMIDMVKPDGRQTLIFVYSEMKAYKVLNNANEALITSDFTAPSELAGWILATETATKKLKMTVRIFTNVFFENEAGKYIHVPRPQDTYQLDCSVD